VNRRGFLLGLLALPFAKAQLIDAGWDRRETFQVHITDVDREQLRRFLAEYRAEVAAAVRRGS
jgi:hypothetical protein